MTVVELILLAVALGSDAFSVAVCAGLSGTSAREKIRLASGFGLFQFLMPIIGVFVGHLFGSRVGDFAGYIGGGLLIFLGAVMFYRTAKDGFHCPTFLHTSFAALLTASLGVSLDALAVGFGLGVLHANLLVTVSVIGAIAFLMTIIGLEIGHQIGKIVQNRAALLGAAILVAIGLRIVLAA